jgi:hypothetical protein
MSIFGRVLAIESRNLPFRKSRRSRSTTLGSNGITTADETATYVPHVAARKKGPRIESQMSATLDVRAPAEIACPLAGTAYSSAVHFE